MDYERVAQMAEMVEIALRKGMNLRALSLTDQLTTLCPEDSTARELRARALLATGSLDEAFREAQVAVLMDAEDVDAQHTLAHTAWRIGRLDLAEEAFEQALTLPDQRHRSRSAYVWFSACEKNPAEASRRAKSFLNESSHQDSPKAWAALALAYLRLDQLDLAEESLDAAFEHDFDCPEAIWTMIHACRRRGDLSVALEWTRELSRTRACHPLFVEPTLSFTALADAAAHAEPVNEPLPLALPPDWQRWLITGMLAGAAIALFGILLPRNPPIALVSLLITAFFGYRWWKKQGVRRKPVRLRQRAGSGGVK